MADTCLRLVDRPHLTAAVVPAMRADAVWQFGLVALRTLAAANRLQGVVRPALGRPGLRMSSLGIRHYRSPLSSLRSPTGLAQDDQRAPKGWLLVAAAGAR